MPRADVPSVLIDRYLAALEVLSRDAQYAVWVYQMRRDHEELESWTETIWTVDLSPQRLLVVEEIVWRAIAHSLIQR